MTRRNFLRSHDVLGGFGALLAIAITFKEHKAFTNLSYSFEGFLWTVSFLLNKTEFFEFVTLIFCIIQRIVHQYTSFRVELLKMVNSKWTYRGKSRAFILFLDAVFCWLIQVQHQIKKETYV